MQIKCKILRKKHLFQKKFNDKMIFWRIKFLDDLV